MPTCLKLDSVLYLKKLQCSVAQPMHKQNADVGSATQHCSFSWKQYPSNKISSELHWILALTVYGVAIGHCRRHDIIYASSGAVHQMQNRIINVLTRNKILTRWLCPRFYFYKSIFYFTFFMNLCNFFTDNPEMKVD